MEKNRYLSKLSSILLSSNSFPNSVVLFFILISVLFPACTKKMSVEEASQVAVSMIEAESFTPPPRRIYDITTMLDREKWADDEIGLKFRIRADASPPATDDAATIANFYHRRGHAAWEVGRYKQALEDLRTALIYADRLGFLNPRLLNMLAKVEKNFGNYRRAIDLLERGKPSGHTGVYNNLVNYYVRIGALEKAKKAKAEGLEACDRPGRRHKLNVQQHVADMTAAVLEAEGKWNEAEPYIRKSIKLFRHMRNRPVEAIGHKLWLVYNLIEQERLFEAEVEARRVLLDTLGHAGKKSYPTLKALYALVSVMLAQGRLQEAEELLRSEMRILEEMDISSDSFLMGYTMILLGNVLAARGDFAGAMEQFDSAGEIKHENQYIYNRHIRSNRNLMLSLLLTGRIEEAMQFLSDAYDVNARRFGKKHYGTAEILAFQAMAYARMQNLERALRYFSEAIPILLKRGFAEEGIYPKNQSLRIILEEYIDVLSRIHGTQLESKLGIDALAETFKLADISRKHFVQRALSASSARAAVDDSELADLLRKEQDALKQIKVLEAKLIDVSAAPLDQQIPEVIEDLNFKIQALRQAQSTLFDEIKRRFPKYSDFTAPQPVTLTVAQKHLRPGEALIVIYPAVKRTYVWAIPHKGKVTFASIRSGNKLLNLMVFSLRKALDPEPRTFRTIPEFDLSLAHNLYNNLLKPVEKGWGGATDLLIVASGPLGQLPFAVLPTALVSLDKEKDELFSKYQQVPWLIRKASITMLPSVSSLVTLRKLPEGDPARKAFVGFGDPFFNKEQLAQAEREEVTYKGAHGSRGGGLRIRGIRVTETGNLDSEMITSSHLAVLNRLPDTAEEIRSIAETLEADPIRDIFLGENASEHQVKTMDLSDRRIIAFATHALVPGDLDGLDQPALALCAPSVTGDNEDGLLTMGEIMKLRMNADWVVLSACNTGAADGAGAEAVSGLGRAFFYAGTRAILVSMWPVETTSAKRLTTGLFRYQKENPQFSRAKALQKSMLELIDSSGLKDDASGKIVASYAHPLFWAPFIIVGESGGNMN